MEPTIHELLIYPAGWHSSLEGQVTRAGLNWEAGEIQEGPRSNCESPFFLRHPGYEG